MDSLQKANSNGTNNPTHKINNHELIIDASEQKNDDEFEDAVEKLNDNNNDNLTSFYDVNQSGSRIHRKLTFQTRC